jgi:hypothetical protein
MRACDSACARSIRIWMIAADTKLPKIKRMEMTMVQRTLRVARFIAPENVREIA